VTLSKTKLGGAAVIAAAAAIALAAGCGSHVPNVVHGREIFMNGNDGGQACAYCHTLRAARAAGFFAPNLDSDIAEDRRPNVPGRNALNELQIRKLVRDQLRIGPCLAKNDPTRCMPPNLVTGGDAADVAAFVARCADNPGAPQCLPPKPADPKVAQGQLLFGSQHCEGCHSTDGNVAVAPTLKGLAGSKVELANGQTVTADDGYLLVAILAPDAQIVKGYKPGFMTAIVHPHSISSAQAQKLLAYIKTLE
jgi:mono/diheme cytochrome c family protein